jgi:hypothetical protein
VVIGILALSLVLFITITKTKKLIKHIRSKIKWARRYKKQQRLDEIRLEFNTPLSFPFETHVITTLIYRFCRVLMTPKEIGNKQKLLLSLIIRSACEGNGKLDAKIVTTMMANASNRKTLKIKEKTKPWQLRRSIEMQIKEMLPITFV